MIIVDRALEEREREGTPIRVGMVGAGFMGRGIARQLVAARRGLRLAAIANRHVEKAERAYAEAGGEEPRRVESLADLEEAVAAGRPAATEDATLVCRAEGIDAVVEVTGSVEFAAGVALEAIAHGKHLVLMNAEVDATVGPILKKYADRAGTVFTNADGDQPGVTMNLYRFVRGLGVRPVLCGSIKGLHDPYRNPSTQEAFARRWGQEPHMVTSFADGSKVSFEQAVVANATGMRVARRGMLGPTAAAGAPVAEAAALFPVDELLSGPGIVDYLVGAEPGPGVFVLGAHDDPVERHYLELYKLGEGPLYCFYSPYHLCHFEVPNTVARAVLFGDATIAPLGPPAVEVVAGVKTDLAAGTTLDRIGGYHTYGLCENADAAAAENLLPLGVAEGSRLLRDVARDEVLTYADVELPPGRLVDRLREEQRTRFREAPPAAAALTQPAP
ncbi:MAG TPA: Gfo/Idh/MocA family oxidoreductase [Gaiellaceae bacterium]|nr:Gfo/Idh/MocA family oxidoreductase [Gaiellaceae bacterium]